MSICLDYGPQQALTRLIRDHHACGRDAATLSSILDRKDDPNVNILRHICNHTRCTHNRYHLESALPQRDWEPIAAILDQPGDPLDDDIKLSEIFTKIDEHLSVVLADFERGGSSNEIAYD